jgi:hypothetical protein
VKIKLFLFFALFIFILSAIGCKEEKPTYYIDQEFKDYTTFGIGSYWVYEDSASSQIDSVYLENVQNTIVNASGFNYITEQIVLHFNSSMNNSYVGSSQFDGASQLDDSPFYIYIEYGGNTMFFSRQSIGHNSNGLTYEKYLDTLNFNGIKYSKIMVFLVKGDFTGQDFPKRTFYANKIGLIRKEMSNGKVWNLKRFHIN